MKNKVISIILCVIVACVGIVPMLAFSASAYEKDFTSDFYQVLYTEENGLPSDMVMDIASTSDGMIWLASGDGLVGFNGYEYTAINKSNTPGFEAVTATNLFVDSSDRLWVGTNDKGVICKDGNSYTVFDMDDGATSNSVRDIAERNDGTIVAATADGIYSINTDNSITVFDNEIGFALQGTMLAVDSVNNNIVCVTNTGAVYLIIGNTVSEKNYAPEISDGIITCVYYTGENNFVFGTQDGRVIYTHIENSEMYYVVEKVATGIKGIESMYDDGKGNWWLLSNDKAGYFDANGEFHNVTNINVQNITAMLVDFQGNYWFSSFNKGIVELCDSSFEFINNAYSLENSLTNCVVEYNEKLYIGCENGINIIDEATGEVVNNALVNRLKGSSILSFEIDSDKLLIGTATEGLLVYSEKNGIKVFNTQNGLSNNRVNIIKATEDFVVIGTNDGVSVYKDDKITKTYNETNGLAGRVLSIHKVSSLEGILIGTESNGAYRLTETELISYNDSFKSVTGAVKCVSDNNTNDAVWAGVGAELYYLNSEKEVKRVEKLELLHEIIDIFHSADGKLWLITSNDIIVADEENLLDETTPLNAQVLNKSDGLTSTVNSYANNYISDSGRLYLCCDSGVLAVNTADYAAERVAPRIVLNRAATPDGELSVSEDRINIPGDTDRVVFNISVLSYLPYEDYKIVYKLEGQDDDSNMIDANAVNEIIYTNLSHGDYELAVSVVEEDGVVLCSDTFSIHQQYSRYDQILLRAFLVALIIFTVGIIVYLIAIIRTVRNRKEQQKFKEITEQAMHAFAKAIDAKDPYTKGHSERVAKYSVEIARRFGVDERRRMDIYYSALLHDIGKIGVPDEILKKPDKLTEQEFEIIKTHTTIGAEILSEMTAVKNVQFGARDHHEKYNGTGYPRGLAGNLISFEGRIVGAADAYDAMTTSRGYNKTRDNSYIREEVIRQSGQQFDPEIAKILIEMIDDKYFDNN